jgi:endonuclease YncB( thermonuclease family)
MKIFFTLLSLFIFSNADAINYGTVTINEVTSIYDGDTFRATIKDYQSIIGKRIPIRISGIDTPELRGKCKKEKILALKAKQFTVSMLRAAHTIELHNMQRGKYFRIVADVIADGVSVGDELLKNTLAVEYHGGHKFKNWCK